MFRGKMVRFLKICPFLFSLLSQIMARRTMKFIYYDFMYNLTWSNVRMNVTQSKEKPSLYLVDIDMIVNRVHKMYYAEIIITSPSLEKPLFNQTYNPCMLFKRPQYSNFITKYFEKTLKEHSTIPLKCPIPKGHFRAEKMKVDLSVMPDFLFIQDFDLKFYLKSFVKEKRRNYFTFIMNVDFEVRDWSKM